MKTMDEKCEPTARASKEKALKLNRRCSLLQLVEWLSLMDFLSSRHPGEDDPEASKLVSEFNGQSRGLKLSVKQAVVLLQMCEHDGQGYMFNVIFDLLKCPLCVLRHVRIDLYTGMISVQKTMPKCMIEQIQSIVPQPRKPK